MSKHTTLGDMRIVIKIFSGEQRESQSSYSENSTLMCVFQTWADLSETAVRNQESKQ